MRVDKAKALELRRSGKSYNEIKQELRIPPSTLSGWLAKSKWSAKIRARLSKEAQEKHTIHIRSLNLIRGAYLTKLYEEARGEAKREFQYFKLHPLFVTGITIYWGEGDKTHGHNVRIANTDPLMIKLFVRFLAEVCGIPKERIRIWILLYPDLDEKQCINFWIKSSGLRKRNFTKSIIIQGRHKTRRVHFGVCNVGVSSKYLKQKLSVWLQLLPQYLLAGK